MTKQKMMKVKVLVPFAGNVGGALFASGKVGDIHLIREDDAKALELAGLVEIMPAAVKVAKRPKAKRSGVK